MRPQNRIIITILAAALMSALAVHAAEEEPKKEGGFIGRITGIFKKKEETPPPAPEKPAEPEKPKTTPKAKSTASTDSSKKKSSPAPAATKSTKSTSVAKTTPAKSEPAKTTASTEKKTEEKPKETAKTPEAPKTEPAKPAEDKKTVETKDSKPVATPEPAKTAAAAAPAPPAPTPAVNAPTSTRTPSASASSAFSAPASSRDELKHDDNEFGKMGDDQPIDVTKSAAASSVSNKENRTLTERPNAPATPLPSTKDVSWDIVKIDGRDYVTGDSIHRFYRFSTHKIEGKHVWFRSTNLIMKAGLGSQELLINNIKFILSFPVATSGGKALFSRLDLCKLIDPVLRPSYITGAEPFNTVVLDAGHGGHDSGAKGVYGYEKDFTLKMAFAVKSALEKRGFKVIMTRSTDTFISRTGRVAIANRTPNCIFVSLHFNSGGSSATGIETFALTPQGAAASLERGGGYNISGRTGNQQDSENIALATAVHALVIHRFKLVDRGIKRAQWTVLTGCEKPGILFEGGFITNSSECRLVASQTYREALANTMGDAIQNYQRALKTNYVQPSRR
jgi:N-acetylmuramoyl-L-alanine amidase